MGQQRVGLTYLDFSNIMYYSVASEAHIHTAVALSIFRGFRTAVFDCYVRQTAVDVETPPSSIPAFDLRGKRATWTAEHNR